ncbi:hypothetical protein QTO34_019401 [Cnephaeus nilssonii]|uniref:Peptidase S1 domain-containing protein n=1 Tax=Cnephaeus nilssonii TaxID=3371016 RepID=A0AA40LP15_CNENI|nr:hypothetical protein QTO34_019401 [Eptesicus nilssonii]
MGSIAGKMQALLLCLVFLLPPEAGAGKIISGIESKPHSRPYMAYLKIISDQSYVFNCGGFLISQEFVVTAAHCKGRKITVILGAHDIKQEESTWQELEVKEQFVHPKYNYFTNVNDIMLLKGDSGGPLLCAGVAQGIVSYGRADAKPPGVFTRISSYVHWINKILKRNYKAQDWKTEAEPAMGSLSEKMGHLPLPLLIFLLCSRSEAGQGQKPGELILQGEIIRDTECKPHSRPYMAHLEIVTPQNSVMHCGGFLIRRNFVLTAAHCAGRSIMVTLGAHNITKKEDTQQKLKVTKQFPHPKFDYILAHHDIMLLKLNEKANLTLAVGTLPLPSQFNFMPPGRMCRVAGWGITEVEKSGSNTLQEVKLRLVDPQACRHFRTFDHNLQLWRLRGATLCAGVAHGIVSYGKAKPPSVFTRISHYWPWINKILKKN